MAIVVVEFRRSALDETEGTVRELLKLLRYTDEELLLGKYVI